MNNSEQNTIKTKTVTVIIPETCGCGSGDVEMEITVPYDSPVKDGDRITDLESIL